MNIQMKYNDMVTLLAILAFVWGASSAQASDDGEAIYARDCLHGRHLVVVKKEVPAEKGAGAVDGKPVAHGSPERLPAGTMPSGDAERVYEYSFIVQSEDGKDSQVVGSKRMRTGNGEVERMLFTVFDAFVYDDQLVVLYKCRRKTYADVAILGPKGTGFLMSDAPLVADPQEGDGWTVGGTIEGSPNQGNLLVSVTTYDPKVSVRNEFRFVNRDGKLTWELQPRKSS